MFAVVTAAVVCGGLAERVNLYSWVVFVALWHTIVYCPLVHIIWHPDGILHKWGVLDFAGGIPVEMAAGFAATTGSLFLGPRRY